MQLRCDCHVKCQSLQDWYHNRIQVCWLSVSIGCITVCQESHLPGAGGGPRPGETSAADGICDNTILSSHITKTLSIVWHCQCISSHFHNCVTDKTWCWQSSSSSSSMIISMSWEWYSVAVVVSSCYPQHTMSVRPVNNEQGLKGCRHPNTISPVTDWLNQPQC